ncbi:MAG TPA: DUF5722 domain-containing protein [Verrucomicrobiae bacterium]|nr:DUF5722 domain-containing protein [Verrucomicrobiae bacterium]
MRTKRTIKAASLRHAWRDAFLHIVGIAGLLWAAVNRADEAPFPTPASKKGLQVQMVDDALALGVRHAALNVNFGQLLTFETNNIHARYRGADFWFSRGYVNHLDAQIKPLSDHGVVVALILLNYAGSDATLNRVLLHPRYDPGAPNHLSAFNTSTPEGARALGACVEFLAERYSSNEHGRVWNYIVGNEVNSHWFWSNMGRVTMEEFADDYLRAVRLCQESVRKHSANARVYISLEHHWNIHYPGGDEKQTFPGRPFVDYFARRARETGDFDWNIAFHPYPENLFDCRTWKDKSATDAPDTPRITFKNIEMLPKYLSRRELLYQGKPRHVILSEQGFHSPETPEGQVLQAAAYCYAYEKVDHLNGIDSFIYHRQVDHGQEGGLNLGVWTRNKNSPNPAEPAERKKIYEVFKAADTPEREASFRFALPVIGISKWEEIRAR